MGLYLGTAKASSKSGLNCVENCGGKSMVSAQAKGFTDLSLQSQSNVRTSTKTHLRFMGLA